MIQELKFKRRSESTPAELRSLTVRVPGSSANLGPGFDALALAYKLYCTLNFRILEKNDTSIPLITLKGRLVEGLSKDQNNLIYTVLSNFWQNDPELLQKIRITVESEIPLGKGIGSSAAAITGAIWSAYALSRNNPEDNAVLAKAQELEGHADNAAASLLGGLVVTAHSAKTKAVVTQKLVWPEDWSTIVIVPAAALSTKKSRSVLPRQYSRADVVHNLQNVALLLAAVQNRDEEAMQEALHDRLHEPYRAELVPELGAVKRIISDLPAIGCVLSGAGSSILTIVNQRQKQQVLDCLHQWGRSQAEMPE
ncbi:MAG: homoserine kinase, partial [Candidatus Obscuribacterales bacterium]|nr:homoserine kinase [Candidatus Obscuribacterales bacterium]